MTEEITANNKSLLSLSADQLLADFGAGKPTPGAGSANAITCAIAANLAKSVAILSEGRPDLALFSGNFISCRELMDQEIPRLKTLFQNDTDIFAKVIKHRREHLAAGDERGRRIAKENEMIELRKCIGIPFEIADSAIKIYGSSIEMLNLGYKAARGDSCTAASLAIAGISGCVGINRLNLLKEDKASIFYDRSMRKIEELESKIRDMQDQLMSQMEQIE